MAKKLFNEETRKAIEAKIAPMTLEGWFYPEEFQKRLDGSLSDDDYQYIKYGLIHSIMVNDYDNAFKYALDNFQEVCSSPNADAYELFRGYVSFMDEYDDGLEVFSSLVLIHKNMAMVCSVANSVFNKVEAEFNALPEESAYKSKYKIDDLIGFVQDHDEASEILKACNCYENFGALLDESRSPEDRDNLAYLILECFDYPEFSDTDELRYKFTDDIKSWIDHEMSEDLSEFIFEEVDLGDKREEATIGWAEEWLGDNFCRDDYDADDDDE